MKNLLNMSDSEDEDKPKKSKRPKKGDAPAIAAGFVAVSVFTPLAI